MTSRERAQHAAEIVKSATEREPQDCAAFLDATCAGDEELRSEVDSLLKFQAQANGFIEQGALNLAAEALAQDGALAGEEIIDDYKILSKIGAGGMGDVYLAEDTHLRRKVALKLVRAAMSTDDIVAKFRYEEQILASLNDPNIAHLYGGGVTANGIPFFVMEYVEGLRIDHYCDRHDLTTAARLALFRKVCSAVHYAHQHLVIHRDLKPSNILVTEAGEPKLLDFGIAKLLKADEAAPAVTLVGVMTPDYASPEQVRGESITTASDVYSLGVIFYELLAGHGPYRVKNRNAGEIARAITDHEPVRPSTTALRFRKDTQSTSRNPKFLKGDLDNIALMAIRKNPARRYQSAAQFSTDIQRHLDGLPVIARKDTWNYRSAKFISRHRVGVAAAVLVLLSLIAGLLTTARQAEVARREKARADEVKNFLERTLNYSNPYLTDKNVRETTVTDVLDEAARRLENEKFSDQPEIKVELEGIISRTYYGQGKRDLAREHLRKYVDLASKLYPENDSRALDVLSARATLLFDRGELSESEKLYRRFLPLMRREKEKGSITAETLAGALNNFGFLRRTQGDSREAEASFREALAVGAQVPPEESRGMNIETRSTLASTLADQGKFDEALQTARETDAEFRQRGETSSGNFAFALTILGGFLTEKGDYAEADANLRAAEAILRNFQTSASLWLGDNLRNQALSFYYQGRYPESLAKVDETLKIYLENFGPHYDNYPTALITKGLSLAKTGKLKEGEKIVREAVKIRTDSLPKEHYWVALANSALGDCLTIQQRYSEAEPLLVGSYESLKKSQGVNNPRTRLALQRLIVLYQDWGKSEAADEYRNKLSSR